MVTMVQLNNYSWGHELLDLLMNQGRRQNQTNNHPACSLLYLCLIHSYCLKKIT